MPRSAGSAARAKRALRIFFATDVHGSDVCFRKFLAAARVYEADVLCSAGTRRKGPRPDPRRERVAAAPRSAASRSRGTPCRGATACAPRSTGAGSTRVMMDDGRARRAREDPAVRRSAASARDRGPGRSGGASWPPSGSTPVRCIITPATTTRVEVDAGDGRGRRVECPHRAVRLGPGPDGEHRRDVPSTPWSTERECSEEELARRSRRCWTSSRGRSACSTSTARPTARASMTAPELDATLKPVIRGGPAQHRAGRKSRGTRRHQALPASRRAARPHPRVAGRAEDRAGTLCVNPGSDYSRACCGAPWWTSQRTGRASTSCSRRDRGVVTAGRLAESAGASEAADSTCRPWGGSVSTSTRCRRRRAEGRDHVRQVPRREGATNVAVAAARLGHSAAVHHADRAGSVRPHSCTAR